ncbi:Probable Zinc-ribbon domain-containing protein [Lachnospiraceae bacterium XPB1003]|nr:Probable Zinc-ribbon domain-containing protein [Lachnospiraceae bacterium XPB1003]
MDNESKTLKDKYPELAKEWHPTKNGNLKPSDVTPSSNIKIWWLFPYDDPRTGKHYEFEWQATVRKRVQGTGCPYIQKTCHTLWRGFNDLETLYPELANQWHPSKNGILLPKDVTSGSRKKVWWKYPYDDPVTGKHFDFEWEAIIRDRVRHPSCPYLVSSSYAVWRGFNDLATTNPELAKEWHPTKNSPLRPEDVRSGSRKKVWWLYPYDDLRTGKHFDFEWQAEINNRANGNAGCPYLASSGHAIWKGFNDLATTNPKLAKEWHPTKNGSLRPQDVSAGSNKKVWWLYPYDDPRTGKHFDFEWQAVINNRANSNAGCPYLSVSPQAIMPGFNDLESTHPELMCEWDYEKNEITPDKISFGSEKKVFWKGKCGHNYKQSVLNHVNGCGCPYCAGKEVLSGFNDLQTLYPVISAEWDFKKNKKAPNIIFAHSDNSYWWKCKLGHSYKMPVNRRTGAQKSSCPVCAKEGKTSFPEQAIYFYLKDKFPDAINSDRSLGFEFDIKVPSLNIAIEFDGKYWHSNKESIYKDNKKDDYCFKNNINLFRIRDKSLKKTKYATIINFTEGNELSLENAIKKLLFLMGADGIDVNLSRDRASILSQYIIKHKNNSLAFLRPDIAEEWNYEKNEALTPYSVKCFSSKIIWWKCKNCGEEWQCRVSTRTGSQAQGCPKCTKEIVRQSKSTKVVNLDTGEVFESVNKAAESVKGRFGDISACCRGEQKTAWGYRWKYFDKPQTSRKKYSGKVINLSNGMVFNSLTEAARWCNGKVMNISACCKKRQKSAYGYIWSYYDE